MIKKYWIIALVSFLLLTGFTTTMLTGYLTAYQSLSEEISQSSLPLTSDNVYSEIQKDLVRSIHISTQMAHDTFVRDWILKGEQDTDQMVRYLAVIQKKFKTVTAFLVSDVSRRYYHPSGIIKTVSEDDPLDAWYFRARSMDLPYEINIDTDTADLSRISIFINYRVYGYDDDLLGVTGVGLELKKVQGILANYKEKYNSDVFFVDMTGRVVLRADGFSFPDTIHTWENFSTRAVGILANPGISFEHSFDGQSFFVSSRYIPEFDLILVILRNNEALKEQLTDGLKLNLVVGFLITLVVVAIVAVVLRKHNQNLERLASIDTLTGTYNRNAFSIVFSQMVKEAKRRKTALSLVLIDIDNFKSINDRFGHHGGDVVLKEFARATSQKIRESDVLCRWGGEEFVILLEGCPLDEAAGIADAIREDIARRTFDVNGNALQVTLSAGVAEHRTGESLAQLSIRADRLMYEAKKQGKNRILSEDHPA